MRRRLTLWFVAITAGFLRRVCLAFKLGRAGRGPVCARAHVAKVEPLSAQANLAYWEAATTGKAEKFEEYAQLQLQIRRIYSDPNDFARVQAFGSPAIRDPRLARQLDKLYYAYLQNQIEPGLLKQIVELDTKVQETYNNYRPTLDGRKAHHERHLHDPDDGDGLRQTRSGLAGQQTGRQCDHRGLPEAGPAAEPGGPEARLRQLSHDDHRHRRAGRRGSSTASSKSWTG